MNDGSKHSDTGPEERIDSVPISPEEVGCSRLTSLNEFRECERLQRETWGDGFRDIVPASLLAVAQKVGGLVAGALDADGQMLGFVFSLAGLVRGDAVHWSHMLAVERRARGIGLGRRLKLFQREQVLADGIERILWTFDPLVARNAHLNFNRLGVAAVEYVPNMYGRDMSSPLHGATETDRLVVEWLLDSPRARWSIEEAPAAAPMLTLADTPIVRPEFGLPGAPAPHSEDLPEENTVRLEVPEDIVYIFEHSPAEAEAWRKVTRVAFLTYLRRGYAIRSFYRDPSTRRCFYVFRRP